MTDYMDESARRGGAFDVGVCFVFFGLLVFWAAVGLALWRLI